MVLKQSNHMHNNKQLSLLHNIKQICNFKANTWKEVIFPGIKFHESKSFAFSEDFFLRIDFSDTAWKVSK